MGSVHGKCKWEVHTGSANRKCRWQVQMGSAYGKCIRKCTWVWNVQKRKFCNWLDISGTCVSEIIYSLLYTHSAMTNNYYSFPCVKRCHRKCMGNQVLLLLEVLATYNTVPDGQPLTEYMYIGI